MDGEPVLNRRRSFNDACSKTLPHAGTPSGGARSPSRPVADWQSGLGIRCPPHSGVVPRSFGPGAEGAVPN